MPKTMMLIIMLTFNSYAAAYDYVDARGIHHWNHYRAHTRHHARHVQHFHRRHHSKVDTAPVEEIQDDLKFYELDDPHWRKPSHLREMEDKLWLFKPRGQQ